MRSKITIKPAYIKKVQKALATFRHMIVYDIKNRKEIPLTPPAVDDIDDCVDAGTPLDPTLALEYALGNYHGKTETKIGSRKVENISVTSIWYKEPTEPATRQQFRSTFVRETLAAPVPEASSKANKRAAVHFGVLPIKKIKVEPIIDNCLV